MFINMQEIIIIYDSGEPLPQKGLLDTLNFLSAHLSCILLFRIQFHYLVIFMQMVSF